MHEMRVFTPRDSDAHGIDRTPVTLIDRLNQELAPA
jgi:hypothetical protein